MATRSSTRTRRRARSKGDATVQDVTGYIEGNPVTSAVVALAAGVIATSVYKMTVGKPNGAEPQTAKPAVKKRRATSRPAG